ncbi:RNA polymerase II-associated protein 1, putative [Plasmodium relictum]|uniref:RNA polymerase II-associated protein 1, putative n=1 Tax=Plasmodium relictum TaxID=85471 RepID=A0A1J1H368_PLARL|nr:RNA polymerase II-associated protein 1, putative [Plasmodium relictum]CRG99191.1 RNA polymerase II-associated protein 1, putative [Plasmodium relictum]
MVNSLNKLQDKLRKERTTDKLILKQCNFDIIEKYDDTSSDDNVISRKEKDNKITNKELINANNLNNNHNVSFPIALHRTKLNLQKNNVNEKLDLKKIYESNLIKNNINKRECDQMKIPNELNSYNIEKNNNKNEKRDIEKNKIKEKDHNNNLDKKYNILFQINKNEVAKLQWTNPVNDTEIREIKNINEVKLHEIRFDFLGKLRIQINENLFNKQKKKKIFDNFDGLYHHNDEPLNSGYTFPEILFLCQSSYNNQVSISLKILKNIFVNLHLKVITINKYFEHIINDLKGKYCYGFTYRRFFNFINNDLKIFKKLLIILNCYCNKNVEINCLHSLASYLFPNNILELVENVIYDQDDDTQKLKYLIDYEFFSYCDFFSDNLFLFEDYNIYFYSIKKEKNSQNNFFNFNKSKDKGKVNDKDIEKETEDEENSEETKDEENAEETEDEENDEETEDKEYEENIRNQKVEKKEQNENNYSNINKKKFINFKDENLDFSNFFNKYKENELLMKQEKDDKIIKKYNKFTNNAKETKGNEMKKKENHKNIFINYELITILEYINRANYDSLKIRNINFKMISLSDSKKYQYKKILNNISNILSNNFGVVEIENSCICVLIGLLFKKKQKINILKNKKLIEDLKKIYDSKITGNKLNNERLEKESKEKKHDYYDINFTYNLITLIRYILIYNYEKNILKKFDILSFLLFQRSLPFSKEKKNKEMYFFLATESIKIFRILVYCNLYIESVDYFHEIINEIHKQNFKNSLICKKFLCQVYLYISTYNTIYTNIELSGFLYMNKVIKTLEVQLCNNFDISDDDNNNESGIFNKKNNNTCCNIDRDNDNKEREKENLLNSVTKRKMEKTKKKYDFNYLCDLELINQCCIYFYSVFLCIKKNDNKQCINNDQINKIMRIVEKLAYEIVEEFNDFLVEYKSENNGNLIISIISQIKDCPLPFNYIIYKNIVDFHLFFVIYIQILNIIINIYFIYEKIEKIKIKSITNIFNKFYRDTLKYFKSNIFEVENILDSYNIFLPVSYLFYNLFKINNTKNMDLLFYSLSFCSSLSLSYFCLKNIFMKSDNTINSSKKECNNHNSNILNKSEQNIDIMNDQKIFEINDEYDSTKDYNSINDFNNNNIIYSEEYVKNDKFINEAELKYDNLGDHIYILLFLQKYLKGKFLVYHTKKNIFILLLKNIFKECKKRIDDIKKENEIIIGKVLKLFLNNYVIDFFSKNMKVSMFVKFFIQIFIVNNSKLIGDYLIEKKNVYVDLVNIAELYIFEKLNYSNTIENISSYEKKKNLEEIQKIVDEFIRNEVKEKKYPSGNILSNFEKNKRNINVYNRPKKLEISKNLALVIHEKIIESFKMANFYNPLFLSILFFFSSSFFPLECNNLLYNDIDLIKMLSKNIFIHFYDNINYVIFTKSEYYGKKQNNYLIDITHLFPSVLSLILDTTEIKLNDGLINYFKEVNLEYSYISLLYFIFYVKNKLI